MVTIFEIQKKYSFYNDLDRTLLLSHVLKKSKEFILAHPEYRVSRYEYLHFYYYIKRYAHGMPIAYLTHQKEFYGLTFFTNKHTLIPRPDTEILVEEVVSYISGCTNKHSPTVLIDIGTGTGCIPIAILKKLPTYYIHTYATDISSQALKVAKKNAHHHHTPITFLSGNLLKPAIPYLNRCLEQNSSLSFIITANLPYLTYEQFKYEHSIQHEPYHALVASHEGLGLYKELFEQIKIFYPASCLNSIYLEIDPSQTNKMISLVKGYFSTTTINIKKDLSKKDRLITITFKK